MELRKLQKLSMKEELKFWLKRVECFVDEEVVVD